MKNLIDYFVDAVTKTSPNLNRHLILISWSGHKSKLK